jgi:uncharacterized protein YkwD
MAARIRLVALASEALRAYPLVKKQTTVGSAPDNDVVIEHQSVSRRHAVIVRRLGRFTVRDLDSMNGTRVNGRRKAGTAGMRPGDELEFGSIRFAVMNSPRRRGLGVAGAVAVAAVLTLAGVGVARYLAFYRSVHRSSALPSALSNPAAVNGSESAAREKEIPEAVSAEASAQPPTRSANEPVWLKTLNDYREMAGLAPVREDPALSAGGFAHARYLVKNEGPLMKAEMLGAELHSEDPRKLWFSPAGLRAARAGDVEQWWGSLPSSRPPPGWAIDEWVASTWHRLAILNPRLRQVGYGDYCEKGACAAVLDVLSSLGRAAFVPARLPKPIQFPSQGATLHLNALGGEWPNPLTSCDGYTVPAGLPITFQLGAMMPARLSAYSLRRDSASQILEACGFDAESYANPAAADQTRGRDILADLGAVVVVPRQPLKPGNYAVEMTVNGHSYSWHFTVAPKGPPPVS